MVINGVRYKKKLFSALFLVDGVLKKLNSMVFGSTWGYRQVVSCMLNKVFPSSQPLISGPHKLRLPLLHISASPSFSTQALLMGSSLQLYCPSILHPITLLCSLLSTLTEQWEWMF